MLIDKALESFLYKMSYYAKQLKKTGCMCGSLPPGETCATCLNIGGMRLTIKNFRKHRISFNFIKDIKTVESVLIEPND